MSTSQPEVFRITGRVTRDENAPWFMLLGIMFTATGLYLTYDARNYGYDICILGICWSFILLGSVYFYPLYKGFQWKTIEIHATGIRYFVRNKLKRDIPFREITNVTAQHIGMRFPMYVVTIFKGKKKLLKLDSISSLDSFDLNQILKEIQKYSEKFNFEMNK